MPVDRATPSGIHVAVDGDKGLATVVAWGKPTVEDFEQATLGILAAPDWRPGYKLLIDYRELNNFAFSTAGISRLSDLFKQHATALGDGRCAVVTPNLFIYGLFRMWQPWLPDELNWSVAAFREYEQASLWLEGDTDTTESR